MDVHLTKDDQLAVIHDEISIFSSRLPNPKRRDMDKILEKYGLAQYDGYELLRKNGGRLPIDTYEFICPESLDCEKV